MAKVEEEQERGNHLSDGRQQKAEERANVSVDVIHEAVRMQGDEELGRKPAALAWSGLAAGLSMVMSLAAEGLLRSHLAGSPWRPLLEKFGYSLGYVMVIAGRQQLFTENTLTAIIPLLAHRDAKTLRKVATLWAVVLATNLAGVHAAVWVLSNTSAFDSQVRHAFLEIGREAANVGCGTAVLRGIFAGWLIALLVWMLAVVRSGQVALIIVMTYIVGLGGFTHIIAGSAEVLFLVWTGALSWWHFAGGYAVPTLIGNVIGGVSLVAALNHGQVVAGRDD